MCGFFRNWNLKKHIAVVLGLYSFIFAIVNGAMLTKDCRKDEQKSVEVKWSKYVGKNEKRRAIVASNIKEPSGKAKIVNGALGICMMIDLFSYPVIKRANRR